MAWGEEILGLLYRETPAGIELLAQSEAINPPGLGSAGVSAVWPERDLVFLATGSDGFRAYVVDPSIPSLTLHRDCRTSGFGTNVFGTALAARCFRHHTDATGRTLVVGAAPGLLVGSPTVHLFTFGYPDGVPDRQHPDRAIRITHTAALECMKWKPVRNLDLRPSGWVAVATSAGVGVFHLSWVPALNQMTDFAAWNRIRVPTGAFGRWWDPAWSADLADVSFGDDHTLYVVKAPEGVWRLALETDLAGQTHRSLATAYYPGVECGMDYTRMLHGWADPDIPTLHHPYAIIADGQTAYVTGWNGKVQRLVPHPLEGVRIQQSRRTTGAVELTFTAPFGDQVYEVESTPGLLPARWVVRPEAQIRGLGAETYAARLPLPTADSLFYRLRVRPGD
jgi:hypothetical protein